MFSLAGMIILVAGLWYWTPSQNDDDTILQTPLVQPITEVPVTYEYKDTTLGFKITFPLAFSSTSNDSLYRIDETYTYTAIGPGKSISGVKFTIPKAMTAKTNLSADSYLSVEHLPSDQSCDAIAFLGDSTTESKSIREGTFSYLFASSSEAAAGNRYEEHVYALADSDPCIAVRYFIHYTAIENYLEGTVIEFDKVALLKNFDRIRKTLELSK